MKVHSEKYGEFKKHMDEMDKKFPMPEGMSRPECVPADLYGKRVNFEKDNASNLGKTAADIQEVYGLTPSPNEKDNGGLAVSSAEDY